MQLKVSFKTHLGYMCLEMLFTTILERRGGLFFIKTVATTNTVQSKIIYTVLEFDMCKNITKVILPKKKTDYVTEKIYSSLFSSAVTVIKTAFILFAVI